MAVRQFNDIPELIDLLPGGGRPGFQYAIIGMTNVTRAQKDGWDLIERMSPFEIEGPLGSCSAIVMGKGESIYAGGSTANASVAWFDPDISDTTGLWLAGEEPVKPIAATPVAAKPIAQPKAVPDSSA